MQHALACQPVKLAMQDMVSITTYVKSALAVHSSQVATVKVSLTFTIINIQKLALTIAQPVPACQPVKLVMSDMDSITICVRPVPAAPFFPAETVQVFHFTL